MLAVQYTSPRALVVSGTTARIKQHSCYAAAAASSRHRQSQSHLRQQLVQGQHSLQRVPMLPQQRTSIGCS
jgi:hypothetical protein